MVRRRCRVQKTCLALRIAPFLTSRCAGVKKGCSAPLPGMLELLGGEKRCVTAAHPLQASEQVSALQTMEGTLDKAQLDVKVEGR